MQNNINDVKFAANINNRKLVICINTSIVVPALGWCNEGRQWDGWYKG